MINIFNKIEMIKRELDSIIATNSIQNFHIALRLNNELYIYLLCDTENDEIKKFIQENENDNTVIKIISSDEYNEDQYYQTIFKERINIKDSRRRFIHLLNDNDNSENLNTPCPVITFYSYKGGIGRSTTLASFAAALANGAIEYQGKRIEPQKVVIIDCDFEAPGFTNYFLNDPGIPYNQNGIIEYLTDAEFDTNIDISNYMWEVAKDPFSGQGEIWVMPAGNLSTIYETNDFLKNSLNHYLEGLARLDIASPMYLMNRIKTEVIDKICEKIKPNFILIDSRTGFNDIFGITAIELSKVMIGFFGNNAQTHPGLHFFIDTLFKQYSTDGLIVNAILPESGWRTIFDDFKDEVNKIATNIRSSQEISLDPLKIRRNSILEKIGIKREDKRDFIELINERQFGDYNALFDKIYDLSIEKQRYIEENIIHDNITPSVSEHEDYTKNNINVNSSLINNTIREISPKRTILETLQKELPHLYADQVNEKGKAIDFEQELKNNRYFFRKCMSDLFNASRMLIIGNKGTGKSYIYESLKYKEIVNELQKKANKPDSYKYHFFHLIELDNPHFFVDTNEFDDWSKENIDKYFSRFWKVFIWRSIMQRAKDQQLYTSGLNLFDTCETPTEISKKFNEIIVDDNKIIAIEKDLLDLDKHLNRIHSNKYIVAIFDPLDKLVKPDKWKDRIAPLIDFWRKKPYSKIFPKLFLRKDLLNKIGNVNNFQEIVNQAVNIEWNKNELFAYFFTLITSNETSRGHFFHIMKQNANGNIGLIEHIEKITGRKKQFPNEEIYLRLASATFFGKYADRNGRSKFGESYDWIYKNLQNTDETISIRPFIDLIDYSIKDSLNSNDDITAPPILHPDYFTKGENRKEAVKRYFNDLASEQNNDDLRLIFEFFDDDRHEKYRLLEFKQYQFENLLKAIKEKYQNRIQNDVKGLTDLLEQSGIVKRNYRSYSFALLYKYRLGLRG